MLVAGDTRCVIPARDGRRNAVGIIDSEKVARPSVSKTCLPGKDCCYKGKGIDMVKM